MIKKFSEIAEGETFTHKGIEYKKTATVKVSCCRSINAHATANEKNTTFLSPNVEVEVNDQL
jgi:hypothetical protein